MDPAPPISRNVIDRRGAATHSLAWCLGFVLGFVGVTWHCAGRGDEDLVVGVSQALDRGQAFWAQRARESAATWRDARVVLFRERTPTSCGTASSDTGPFYCPPDERIYLDLSFLRAIDGDATRAYVLAHELGHHVAKVMGYRATGIADELLADCLAGDCLESEVRAGRVPAAAIDAVLAEAESVGDDRLCPDCSPERWTHGSGEQRRQAVARGYAGQGCAP